MIVNCGHCGTRYDGAGRAMGDCPSCERYEWRKLDGGYQKLVRLFLHAPEWLRRSIAGAMNWFWLPCPRCETPFSGLETLPGASIPDEDDGELRHMVCPLCWADAVRERKEREAAGGTITAWVGDLDG